MQQVASRLGVPFATVFEALEAAGFVEDASVLASQRKGATARREAHRQRVRDGTSQPHGTSLVSPPHTPPTSGGEGNGGRKTRKKRAAQQRYPSLKPAMEVEGFYDWLLSTYKLTPARLDEILNHAEAKFVIRRRPRTMMGLRKWITNFVANEVGAAVERLPPVPAKGAVGGPSPAEARAVMDRIDEEARNVDRRTDPPPE